MVIVKVRKSVRVLIAAGKFGNTEGNKSKLTRSVGYAHL